MPTVTQFLAAGSGAAITTAQLDPLKQSTEARVLVARGTRMRTKQSALNELSAALQFPLDFGNNWDALADCLSDLDWLGGSPRVVLGIADPTQVLADDSDAFTTFAAVLADRGPRILLSTGGAPQPQADLLESWSAAGLPLQRLS